MKTKEITKLLSIVTLVLVISTTNLMAQTRVSGFVRDSLTREVLIGAHVIDSTTNRAVVTNNNGFFSISSTVGNQLTFSFVGYQPKTIIIDKSAGSLMEVLLSPGTDIDEVVVTHISRPAFNISSLSSLDLQQIPSLGAKPDIMKSIQLLPGISSQYEGSSLISVRGGNPGENLYLFDNVAVIYVNHLGGFMSVFNPDMINNIDIYKGGFPSRYGGRLSSIMDIAQREGNPNTLSSSLSVGITDLTYTVDGPINFIENSSFMFTGRKTLVDPLLGLLTFMNDASRNIMAYGFHDFNGKFTWRPNPESTLSFNLYQGDDYLGIFYKKSNDDYIKKARYTNIWGNWLLSARWNRVHRPGLYSSQSLSFVRYRLREKQVYQNTESDHPYRRRYLSAVQDISYKWGWKADLNRNWNMDFGLQSSYFRHLPNRITITDQDRHGLDSVTNSLETGIYMDNNWTIGRILQLRAGARGVGYLSDGFSKAYLEPRFNLDINLTRNHTLNLSYMEVTQFSHLLFTSGSINNNEVWIPSDKDINPASSRQITAGWRASFNEGLFDAEVNVYHKTLENL
ncbi:MAG: carboxypeptidase-like regulatory domain-containing protein, partial [Bacteroidales bacterium]